MAWIVAEGGEGAQGEGLAGEGLAGRERRERGQGIRFHDIRHTFVSQLLQQGESLHYVKEQMGHASIQTTVGYDNHRWTT